MNNRFRFTAVFEENVIDTTTIRGSGMGLSKARHKYAEFLNHKGETFAPSSIETYSDKALKKIRKIR